MTTVSRRELLIGASAFALLVGGAAPAQPPGADPVFTLPELPPMPMVPAPKPEESVEISEPSLWPESQLDFPIAHGPFGSSWSDIERAYPTGGAAWLREAKFGIWVHFGPQSAGNSGDWYAKRMYDQADRWSDAYKNHVRNFGHPSEFGYKDLLNRWNPQNLDPEALVNVYKAAGARFLLVQGVHHDNYDNWNSKYQQWNSVTVGPKRDLIGEWAAAARKEGMRYGVTFHHEYTWWWWQPAFGADATGPNAGVPYDANLTLADGKGKWWDGLDPRMLYTINLREYKGLDTRWAPPKGIFQNHEAYARWYATWWAYRIMDVIEHYDPDFIYTDGDSDHPFTGEKSGTGAKNDAASRVVAHFYNRTKARRACVDTFSVIKFKTPTKGLVTTQEGGFPDDIKRDQPWIGEVAVGDWFWAPGFIYEASSVVRYVLETASRDGASAICIPMQSDGSLEPECLSMLKEVGEWMSINGDGIYGSQAWKVLGEGELIGGKLKVSKRGPLGRRQKEVHFNPSDFRFTMGRDGAIYAYCMVVPEAGAELVLWSLSKAAAGIARTVELLGYDGRLIWHQDNANLKITVPVAHGCKIAMGFRVVVG